MFLREPKLNEVNGNNYLFVFKIMFVAGFVLVQLRARSSNVHKGRMSCCMLWWRGDEQHFRVRRLNMPEATLPCFCCTRKSFAVMGHLILSMNFNDCNISCAAANNLRN